MIGIMEEWVRVGENCLSTQVCRRSRNDGTDVEGTKNNNGSVEKNRERIWYEDKCDESLQEWKKNRSM